ncbi:MAG: Ig-like domain-containing protein [Candidatus Limimorpha sp.]
MKFVLKYLLIILSALFLFRCANVVTPNGGPKDITPPIVVETSPLNNSTNFNGRTITITFDEYFTLNNASDNILISPPLATKPDFQINRKSLIIKAKEPLKEETTYSINFGNAVKDLHEGNIFNGFDYIFSTGPRIDTLSVQGNVVSAASLKPCENFIVALYSVDNDTVNVNLLPRLTQPDYLAKTNKDGFFQLSGLSDKDYFLFALKDGNSNTIFDLPNEEIGFYPELIRPYYIDNKIFINDSAGSHNVNQHPDLEKNPRFVIKTFIQEDSVQKLFKKELADEGILRFVFRYPADDVTISVLEPLPDSFNIIPAFSERRDTLLWYFTPNKDSLWVSINYDTLINDTTHFSLVPRKSVSRKNVKKDNVNKTLNVKDNIKGGKIKPEQPLLFSFGEPIVRTNPRDILFIVNNDTVTIGFPFQSIDGNGCGFHCDMTFEPEGEYKIIVPDSVFYGLSGRTNDTVRVNFKVGELSQYGNIFVPLEFADNVPQIIVELTNDKDKTIDKQIVTEPQKLSFLYLEPGKYKLKATIDSDGNGIWSPGNLERGLQPEKVILFDDVLELRANWDINLDEFWEIK